MTGLIGMAAWLAVIGFPVALIAAIFWLPGAYRRSRVRTVAVSVIAAAVVVTGVLIVGSSSTI
jgi:hypothetical protein